MVAKAKRQLQMFLVAKAKRQLQMFLVAKAKRQLQMFFVTYVQKTPASEDGEMNADAITPN
ncbi:hypothetical protein FJQ98_24840 [Lysinibacillus agricola]|uniref:Transposase n=1 Tax=Lysinibacillus agricola TaxID=2590012 RepID=A0ABX7AQP9_9BACI|nr:hypothetical protein [Lysinibacillus agricola]QQP12282.1 hypothetical protein FJQ98_24840 [Lysinibacillus agricola]